MLLSVPDLGFQMHPLKVTISFVMCLSVCPSIGLSVHMEPGSYWTEFHEI